MSEVHDFNDCLENGNEWEEEIAPKLKQEILNISISQVSYGEEPEKQLSGIDQVLSREEFNIDVKVRDSKYCCNDLFIETISVLDEDKPGWVENEETDIIAYCWENKPGDNLQNGVLLLLNEHFQEWFEGNKREFSEKSTKSEDGNSEWVTKGRIVPIERVPEGFIYTDFNPTLPKDLETSNQERLSNYTD